MSQSKLMGARPRALAVAVTLCCIAPAAMAASRQDLQNANLAQLQSHYSSFVATNGTPEMAHSRHERFVGTDSESRLLLLRRNSDSGKRTTRYQQTFRGIPVWGENIVVSENARTGRVEALFGRRVDGLAKEVPNSAPRLSAGNALATAKKAWFGNQLSRYTTARETADKMIYVDGANRAHLAYVVSFYADVRETGKPTRPVIILDANSGTVLRKYDNLQSALVGTGPGGNEKIGQYEYGTDFGFLDVAQTGTTCAMENINVRTIDVNHRFWTPGSPAPSDLQTFTYTCPRHTGDSINGAYSPLNDAHYFGEVIFDMYSDYMNASPLTFKLQMRVHFGTNYENAFWDGTGMTFGDGRRTFYPLVSLDVSGHEVSHGFTEQNSGLIYDSGQSGAMNESFSDMAGEAAEYFMNGTNDFLVGAQIFKASGALRYMCNPTQDHISIDNAADMPAGGMNNHYSSGVYNKAFCNLAQTPGWTTKTAFQAFARANRDYWVPTSNWNSAACGVQLAAADMGMNVSQVVAAFATVGVTAEGANCGGGGTNTAPVANFSVAKVGLIARFTDASTDAEGNIASRSWDFGDGSSSTATSPTHKYAAPGRYDVTETVTDAGGLSNSKTTKVTVLRRR